MDEKGPLPDLDLITFGNRDVVILFDANAATNNKVQAARRAFAAELAKSGAKVRIGELPAKDNINGPDDYIGAHGDDALFVIIDAAKPVSTRNAKPPKPKQGREVTLDDPEPWADPVDGAPLLAMIVRTFEQYLALPKHASAALGLWVLHAYAMQAWFVSPFLAVSRVAPGNLTPRRSRNRT